VIANYITVNNCVPPVADFIATDTLICTGDTVNFFDLTTGTPTAWQWTFFGGTPATSSVQNPTGIVYSTPGTYTVQLFASNSTGSDTMIKTNYIQVDACLPPIADFSASSVVICEDNCIDFTDATINNPTSWLWIFQGGSPATSTLQNPSNVCYSDSGQFNVTLIVSNIYGSDTLLMSDYIEVDTCPRPHVYFTASDTDFCSSPPYNCINFFDFSDNTPTQWHWIFPGATPDTSNLQNPSNIFNTLCFRLYRLFVRSAGFVAFFTT